MHFNTTVTSCFRKIKKKNREVFQTSSGGTDEFAAESHGGHVFWLPRLLVYTEKHKCDLYISSNSKTNDIKYILKLSVL